MIFRINDLIDGRYRVLKLIGSGNTGAVYRAYDEQAKGEVAVKVINAALMPTHLDREAFIHQIQELRQLEHPNIALFYGAGIERSRVYTVHELLEGVSLRKVIQIKKDKGHALPLKQILPIFQQLTQAFDFAHDSLLHGGFKPENVLVLKDRIKITDFGSFMGLPRRAFLAVQRKDASAHLYLAPEVREGRASLTTSTDIYSLGVLLTEMLTGVIYDEENQEVFQRAILELSEPLRRILSTSLSNNSDHRPGSAGQLFRQVQAASNLYVSESELEEEVTESGANFEEEEEARTVILGFGPNGEPLPIGQESSVSGSPDESMNTTQAVSLSESLSTSTLPDLSMAEGFVPVIQESPAMGEAIRPPPVVDASDGRAVSFSRIEAEPDLVIVRSEGRADIEAKTREDLPAQAIVEKVAAKYGGEEEFVDEVATEYGELPQLHLSQGPLKSAPSPPEASVAEDTIDVPWQNPAKPAHKLTNAHYASVIPGTLRVRGKSILDPSGRLQEQKQRKRRNRRLWTAIAWTVMLTLMVGGAAWFAFDRSRMMESHQLALAALEAREEEAQRLRETVNKTLPPTKAPVEMSDSVEPTPPLPEAGDLAESALDTSTSDPGEPSPPPASALAINQVPSLNEAKLTKDSESNVIDEPKPSSVSSLPPEKFLERTEVAEPGSNRGVEASTSPESEPKSKAKTSQQSDESVRASRGGNQVAAVVAPPVKTPPECPTGMAYVSGGAFMIGTPMDDPDRQDIEREFRSEDVPDFCIDYYEHPNGRGRVPTVKVSYTTAEARCRRRGKRLCKEEEWEKACKGPAGFRYPYGNSWSAARCNTQTVAGETQEFVGSGSFRTCRSGYNVYDLGGNVAEWTSSEEGDGYITKGGAASLSGAESRCSSRQVVVPNEQLDSLGFRCCTDIQ